MINTSYARFSQLKPRFAASQSQQDLSEPPLGTFEEEATAFKQAFKHGASTEDLLKLFGRLMFARRPSANSEAPHLPEQPLGTFEEELEALIQAVRDGVPHEELLKRFGRLIFAQQRPQQSHRPPAEPMIAPPGYQK